MNTSTLAVAVDNSVKPEVGKVYVTKGGHTLKPMRYKKRNDSDGYVWHTELEGQLVRRSYNAHGKCKGADRSYDLKYVYHETSHELGLIKPERLKKAIPMDNPQPITKEVVAILDKELGILSLEVGKMYVDGEGIAHHIIWYNEDMAFFLDTQGDRFRDNGLLLLDVGTARQECNLVSEYREPAFGHAYVNVFRSADNRVFIGQRIFDSVEAAVSIAEARETVGTDKSKCIARAKFLWVEGMFEE